MRRVDGTRARGIRDAGETRGGTDGCARRDLGVSPSLATIARAEREDEREGDARTRGNRVMCGVCASMTDVCVV